MAIQNADEISLRGKVVIVTGGAGGIGQAVVRLARRFGAQVVSCDLKPSPRDSESSGADLSLVGDVSREEDCAHFIRETLARFDRLDVLVNNAGLLEVTRCTVNQDLATWKRVMEVNLQGTYAMSRAAATAMTDAGISGCIVNLSSIAGLAGFRASNAYGVSKAGVAMLTKTLAADLASCSIRVNAVAPGLVATAMIEDLDRKTSVDQALFLDRIPLRRFGDPIEIARVVVFLASDWASYITGAVLPVDGGWTAFGGPSNS